VKEEGSLGTENARYANRDTVLILPIVVSMMRTQEVPRSVVATIQHQIVTRGQGDAHDITTAVSNAVSGSKITSGVATIFVVGSTAAVTTIEFEPGAVADFNRLLEHIAPRDVEYRHHLRWGDDNGSSHVRAALLGPSLSVPFSNGKLLIGTWQQIMLLELDTRPRQRQIVIQIMGEAFGG